MLYTAYQTHTALAAPLRAVSALTARAVQSAPPVISRNPSVRRLAALSQVLAGARLTHVRPPFGIDSVRVDGRELPVREEVVDSTPFADMLRFTVELPDGVGERTPVLLVAPMSGHFATMLTATVRSLLADHDVHVTDWRNARDVPLHHGRFGLDEYTDHLIRFIRHLGPDVHVIAVCQPAVPALMATAVLAQRDDEVQPRSLTLMAGPIDTRVSPTKMNTGAARRSIEWFRRTCVTTVPRGYPGAGRRVYPGFLQVSAFMSMNLRRHVESHVGMYRSLVAGDAAAAATTAAFYAEYFAVLDMTEEFYLDTVRRVFLDHELPRGVATHHGRPVDPSAITQTALLTVEAERDDMCAPGQTDAAHRLVPHLRDDQRGRWLQPGVGHYGIFAGRRWEAETYPVIRDFIARHARAELAPAI